MLPLYDAIIIGAGISGLTLASRLKEQNKKIILLEKSAGVGGRIATRRSEDCTFDHGAQFIKFKRSDKDSWLDPLKIQEKGKVWFSSAESDHIVFPKGMTQLPKTMVSNLDLKLNERVIRIDVDVDQCYLETERGTKFRTKQLYVTSPLPQSLALLKTSKISYPLELDEIHYASALVGLFRVQSLDNKIIDIRYLQDLSKQIYSLSNQLSKEVSQNLAFTVVMQPAWSERFFDLDESNSLSEISGLFENALNQMSPQGSYVILSSQLKKWRYSHPLTTFKSLFCELDGTEKIFLLGDAFGGASIPGAIRSAYAIPLAE